MPEILLHYIWQKRIWSGFPQMTTNGEPIEIISVGEHNIHAGSDFSNAHIRINGQDWIGNIEIHVHASDWYKHRHHQDPAYDNTILHVICQADKEAFNSQGQAIVQCQLKYPQDKDYITQLLRDAQLIDTSWGNMECSQHLLAEPSLLTDGWKRTLLEKRLHCKCQSIQHILNITQQSWLHAFYISLAHNFGFHTNGLPFESLAINTPLSCLQKHRNSLFQLTAILLGQSGLLKQDDKNIEQGLWEEYRFLQKKFSLTPISSSMWKKARMRPQSAPEVRIRQFAHLLYQSEHLFAHLMEATNMEQMVKLLTLKYDEDSVYDQIKRPLPLGRQSIEVLLINTVIPYRHAYSMAHQNVIEPVDTFRFLEQIPKENNRIIRQWEMLGQHISSAADTQALIHLFQNYCQPHLCYNCQVGYQIFAQKKLNQF